MPGGRNAVLARWHTAGLGDLFCDLAGRQNSAVARFGALAELDLDHPDLRICGFLLKGSWVKATIGVPAAKIPAADFPDQIAAMVSVVRTDTPLAGVMGKASQLCALVQCKNGVGTQRSEAHRRDVQDGCSVGLPAIAAANVDAERGGITGGNRAVRMPDKFIAAFIDIKLGAKCALAAFVLRPRVDQ